MIIIFGILLLTGVIIAVAVPVMIVVAIVKEVKKAKVKKL